MSEYIGKRIVPKHCGEWDGSSSYEVLSIVLDKSTGDSYIAKKEVPAGMELTDTEYWALCSQFSSQIDEVEKQLTDAEKDINLLSKRLDANVTASTDANADYAAEVVDARVDADGKTYSSAGANIRAVQTTKADKVYAYGLPFSYQGPVNINTTLHQVEFPGNFLILASKIITVKAPDPVPYNENKLLTYICYNISGGTLVTHDWFEPTEKDEIVVFAVAGTNPIKSYGMFPFLVDGIQPFASGTVSGNSLADGTVMEGKLADGTVTNAKLGAASVSSDKLLPDALMSMAFDAEITPYTYNKAGTEIMEDGTLHYSRTDEDSSWMGGGFSVPKATRFEKLYIDMTYMTDKPLHFYVIASTGNFILGQLAVTVGESQTVRLEIPKAQFDEHGHTADTITVAFTFNQAFDLYIYSVHARYVDTDSEYFGEDYEKLKAKAASNTEDIQNLSAIVEGLSASDEEIKADLEKAYTGKKILFMGDSITALGTGDRGWLKYFNEIIKPLSFVNTAVASARWCDYSDTVYDGNPVFNGEDANHNNVMGNQVEKLLRGKDPDHEGYSEVAEYADFDMILIACGTNDGTPTAEIEPSFTSSNEAVPLEDLDRTVMPSAFRYVIENLQALYPNALIFICTPIQGYITTRSYSSIKAKGDYLKSLAGRMSVEVIDTFECGVCDIYEKKSENGRYLIDGLHPNAAGAKVMGRYNAKMVINRYV